MKLYLVDFTVEGAWDFPYDMLRFDSCFPVTQKDVRALVHPAQTPEDYDEKRAVTLRTITHNKTGGVTPARWESFGWLVTKVEESRPM